MVVVLVALNLMLLLRVELVALLHKNFHQPLVTIIQYLLIPLTVHHVLLLAVLVLVLMVSIVHCLTLIEHLFRQFLVSLMPLLDSLHLPFLFLLLLVLAVLYLPLPRAVLMFPVVLKNHILLILLLCFWLIVPMNCISVPFLRASCFIISSLICLSNILICWSFNNSKWSLPSKNYPEDLP